MLDDHREEMYLSGIDISDEFWVLVCAPNEMPAWVQINWFQLLDTSDLLEEDFFTFREDGVPHDIAFDILAAAQVAAE